MQINDLIKGNKNLEVRFSKYETDLKQLSKGQKSRYFVYWFIVIVELLLSWF